MNSHLERVKKFHNCDASHYVVDRYRCDTCEGLAYVTRKELVLTMTDMESGDVLDVGCGPGILTCDLLARGHRVYSADLSRNMLEEAREKTAKDPASAKAFFALTDASNICFPDNRMDMVLSIGLMCYVKNHDAVLSEFYRVLRPGGIAVIQINNIRWPFLYGLFVPFYHFLKRIITTKQYAGMDFNFNFSSRKDFLKSLERNNFTVLDVAYYDFRVPFLDILSPGFSVKLGQFLFRNNHRKWVKYLSHGLLIKVGK